MASASCAETCLTCARLRWAMTRLAGEQGFATVSADRLARAGDVAPDEVLVHASSLEQLLVDTYHDLGERVFAIYRDAFATERTWCARFEAGNAAVLDLYAAEPAVARLLEVEVLRAGSLSRAARDAGNCEWVRHIAATLALDTPVSDVRLELLRGAQCHILFETIVGGDLRFTGALRRRLAEVIALFQPSGTEPRGLVAA